MLVLDNRAENLLKIILREHSDIVDFVYLDEDITGLHLNTLKNICTYLEKNEFLRIINCDIDGTLKVSLSHKALCYFEIKQQFIKEQTAARTHRWVNTVISFLSLIISAASLLQHILPLLISVLQKP